MGTRRTLLLRLLASLCWSWSRLVHDSRWEHGLKVHSSSVMTLTPLHFSKLSISVFTLYVFSPSGLEYVSLKLYRLSCFYAIYVLYFICRAVRMQLLSH